MILFTKTGCGKCDYVKARIPAQAEIRFFEIDTPSGLAELAYQSYWHPGIVELAKRELPILVADRVVSGAVPIVRALEGAQR
jgi:hypothetical protein